MGPERRQQAQHDRGDRHELRAKPVHRTVLDRTMQVLDRRRPAIPADVLPGMVEIEQHDDSRLGGNSGQGEVTPKKIPVPARDRIEPKPPRERKYEIQEREEIEVIMPDGTQLRHSKEKKESVTLYGTIVLTVLLGIIALIRRKGGIYLPMQSVGGFLMGSWLLRPRTN
jgi:hypothetical protein